MERKARREEKKEENGKRKMVKGERGRGNGDKKILDFNF